MGGRMRPRSGLTMLAALAAASALLLTGCTSDPLADQYREGSGKNYIAGDGTISEYAGDQRGEPIAFSGETVEGEAFDSADTVGDVTVVNFWYAGCAPCRVEAPELAAADASFEGQDVAFLGVNLYDGAEASRAFADTYGVSYPSALATEDGSIKLAFAGESPLNAVPVTLVLDKEGRVAARLVGQIEDASILETIVRETLEES